MKRNDEFYDDPEVRYICGCKNNPNYYESFRNGEVERNHENKPGGNFYN